MKEPILSAASAEGAVETPLLLFVMVSCLSEPLRLTHPLLAVSVLIATGRHYCLCISRLYCWISFLVTKLEDPSATTHEWLNIGSCESSSC